jgi:hypothetical protein
MNELDDDLANFLAAGERSGFGIAATIQARPVCRYNGHIFSWNYPLPRWALKELEEESDGN